MARARCPLQTTIVEGYLSAVENPQFSGLATVTIRTVKHPTTKSPGKRTTCYCESGYGVRVLVDALGDGRRLTPESALKKCRFTITDGILLANVEPLTEET